MLQLRLPPRILPVNAQRVSREEQFFLEILNPGYFINLWNFSLQRGELLGCMMTALSGRHVGAIQCDLKKCPGSVTARPWGLIFSP